jgi:hypothetical protein
MVYNRASALKHDYVDALNSLEPFMQNSISRKRPTIFQARFPQSEPRDDAQQFGGAAEEQGLLTEALSEFEAANAADSNYAMAFFNAGTVLRELKTRGLCRR